MVISSQVTQFNSQPLPGHLSLKRPNPRESHGVCNHLYIIIYIYVCVFVCVCVWYDTWWRKVIFAHACSSGQIWSSPGIPPSRSSNARSASCFEGSHSGPLMVLMGCCLHLLKQNTTGIGRKVVNYVIIIDHYRFFNSFCVSFSSF